MSIDLSQCRICLLPKSKNQLKSIFNKDIGEESAAEIMELFGVQTLEYTYLLPSKICIKCWNNVSIAKRVREQCINSDNYFKNLLLGGNTKIEIINYEEEETADYIEVPDQEEEEKVKIDSNELIENPEQEQQSMIIDHGMAQIEFLEDSEEPAEEYCENDEYYMVDELIEESVMQSEQEKPDKTQIIRINSNNDTTIIVPLKKLTPQCSTCGKICRNHSTLKTHEKIHAEKPKDKKFQCDICGEFFAFKSYIYRHMNYIHINAKKHVCNVCGKGFSRSDNLKNHIYSHMESKPYPCTYCPKQFVTKQLLQCHVRSHTGERPYKCTFLHCTKSYIHYTDLKRHTMTHTGERPYHCSICNRGFIKRSSQQIHEKTHLKYNTVYTLQEF